MTVTRSEGRRRGRIEKRGGTLRVVVYAGPDPVTGRGEYKREKVDVDRKRAPASTVSLSCTLDEWLRTTEIGPTQHPQVAQR